MVNPKIPARLVLPLIIGLILLGGITTFVVAKNASAPYQALENTDTQEQGNFVLRAFLKLIGKDTKTLNTNSLPYSADNTEGDNCPSPNTWAIIITPEQINKEIDNIDKYEFRGFRIKGGEVTLGDNLLEATVDIGEDRKIYLKLVLTDKYINGGRDFEVEEIRSVGSNDVSKIELLAIKTTLNNADLIMWNYIDPEYKRMFQFVEIHPNQIYVSLYTSEYLNCKDE